MVRRSVGEDVLRPVSLNVQVPIGLGDLIWVREGNPGGRRFGADENVDGDSGGVDTAIGDDVVQVVDPVPKSGLRGVGGRQHGIGTDSSTAGGVQQSSGAAGQHLGEHRAGRGDRAVKVVVDLCLRSSMVMLTGSLWIKPP